MPPKGVKHKQDQLVKKKTQQLRSKVGDMKVGGQSSSHNNTAAPIPPATKVLITKFPLFEKWESLEAEEAQAITNKHASQVRWFQPLRLPVVVHVAAPQAGRFTREIEADIEEMNSIEAITDLVKSSLVFELIRTNIDPSRTRFAGLMIYGPTNEFAGNTIASFTRGLFLQEAAYKKWWIDVNRRVRAKGDMVKIAVVLWDADEAAAKVVAVPNFWTDEKGGRVAANHLVKLEMPIWDLAVEKGCRSYIKMQEQVLEARIAATAARKGDWKIERKELVAEEKKLNKAVEDLRAQYDALAAAVEDGDTEKAARLVAAAKSAAKGKGEEAAKADIGDDEDGDEGAVLQEDTSDEDGDEEMVDVDDSNDEDYQDN